MRRGPMRTGKTFQSVGVFADEQGGLGWQHRIAWVKRERRCSPRCDENGRRCMSGGEKIRDPVRGRDSCTDLPIRFLVPMEEGI